MFHALGDAIIVALVFAVRGLCFGKVMGLYWLRRLKMGCYGDSYDRLFEVFTCVLEPWGYHYDS